MDQHDPLGRAPVFHERGAVAARHLEPARARVVPHLRHGGSLLHLISTPPCWLMPRGCGSCPAGPEVRGTQGERRMPTGTVKWFNPDKGFGFIQPQDGGKDVFVHITAVQAAGLQSLNENQKVTYEVVTERGKQAAANLKPA
jgi:cold shock protein